MRILKPVCFFIVLICIHHGVIADYVQPTTTTNRNVQSDLFEKSVGDVRVFKSEVELGKNGAIEKLNSPNDQMEFMSGVSSEEVERNSSGLSQINANDLNSMGRKELVGTNIIEAIYINGEDSLMDAHRRDAEDIAKASGGLIDNLLGELKKLGVDCKKVKGNKEIEPEYHIDIHNEQIKDAVYKKTLCAEPRNSYNCNNSLIVRCSKLGIRWGAWQNRTMVRTFDALPNHWFHFVRTANRSDKFKINNAYHYEIEAYIANIIGAKAEQISASNQNVVLHQSPHLSNLNRPGTKDQGEKYNL